ncbi:hypothetical protein LBMAG27_06700 [Bacteroidota bacterium]|nr:hypothetical protein LBMAG27_06700 [Bacteroidota bacterium]
MADIKTETKISVLIEKVNYLFQSIQFNNGVINKIDKDLLLNYVRELYELTLSLPVDHPQSSMTQQFPPQYQQPQQPQQYYQQPSAPPPQQYIPPLQQPAPPPVESPKPQQQIPTVPLTNGAQNGNGNGNGTNSNGARYSNNDDAILKSNPGQSLNQSYSGKGTQKTVSDIYSAQGSKPTVNEKLNQPHTELNDKLRKAPIKDLKTFIGLNKRFSYINFLFNNDARLYDESIEKINNSSNYDEAMDYIENSLRNRLHWNTQDEMVAEFYNIVERRFLV